MKKQQVNNTDALAAFLSGPIRDTVESLIGDVLAPVRAPAGFFIYLHPDKWQVSFLGINGGGTTTGEGDDFAPVWESLKEEWCQQSFAGDTGGAVETHRRLFAIVFDLADKHGLTLRQLQSAAVRLLTSKGLALGNTIYTAGGEERVGHWTIGGPARPLLRFQDSLDWAATYKRDLRAMKQRRTDAGGYAVIHAENPTVLKVPTSAARANLVTADNLDIFLAEHILALDEQTFSRQLLSSDPSLTLYFLPIRGLGQWRAAINWISLETSGDVRPASLESRLSQQTSELAKSALEELMTTTLLNIFDYTARKIQSQFNHGPQERRRTLRDAFSMLWLSKEIRYFKEGHCIERLERDPDDGSMVPTPLPPVPAGLLPGGQWKTIAGSRYEGFLSHDGRRHTEPTTVRLVIDPVIARVTSELGEAARLKGICPFDEVQYSLVLFQADETELMRWGDQLAQCLEQIVKEQDLRMKALSSQRDRVHATVHESTAHVLKGGLSIAGLDDARNTLDGLLRESPQSVPLKKIRNSLNLLTVLEGSVHQLRLNSILHTRDYSKLSKWFDEGLLALWNSTRESDERLVLRRYKDSVVHLARAIGSSLGRPWVEVTVEGETETFNEDCPFEGSRLRFLPLTDLETSEAVYALLPALVEPLTNALEFYYRFSDQLPARAPIKLVIEDNRHGRRGLRVSHIAVRIGNLCPTDIFSSAALLRNDPPGVRQTRELLAFSRLAAINPTSHDGTHRWVNVLIHPQRLYLKVRRMQPRPAASCMQTERMAL